MTFEEITKGLDNPIRLITTELGQPEEFLQCEECNHYVRARPEAWELHTSGICELRRGSELPEWAR
jgi:hypothetical protein